MKHLSQIMTKEPAYLTDQETVRRAAELMADLDVGELPICDGRRLVGVVTDRDITVRCTAKGVAPEKANVREAMSEHPVWCYEDDSVEDARSKMENNGIRRVIVVDRDKQLVGVVSLGDVAVKAGGGGDTLASVSQPARPAR
ncbi:MULTISPECIES: CBS domain-containing protein [Bordetella]|uniref:CBS domain-containing protein n=1 Tax=Bordetella genomosp. 6 TaxID=463024 RepID=A0ABX4F9K4_9BORD|nr:MULTISPECIES: CBS domain-containing protein [Bordetella]AOB25630.1 CBS domain-containing protein [Bordetella bronchiseptica]AZW42891.1 CBS domain-containing protein [Bordetella bronchiseptica]KCV65977.1 CBS domain protein [Bordetella bronchiseptica 99-R-0433]MBN3268330.1 CBS domain-containing protein [Bordetella bronchiseptica]OZI73237.1 CBS domain-containing protein [Bordetella genomosp. 6]